MYIKYIKGLIVITLFILFMPALHCQDFFVADADTQRRVMRIMEQADDESAIAAACAELKIMDQSSADSFGNAFIDSCTVRQRYYLMNQVVRRMYMAGHPRKPTGELERIMRGIGALTGEPAPDFSLTDSIRLSDIVKDKEKTILFFYDNTCHTCKKEMMRLGLYLSDISEHNMRLVTVDCNPEATRPVDWEFNVHDPDGKILHRYGVVITPTYFLLDKDGRIESRCPSLDFIGLLVGK